MNDKSEGTPKLLRIEFEHNPGAPTLFFDGCNAFGVFNGVVEVELAGRALVPQAGGDIIAKVSTIARLRCSATAAVQLRNALDRAIRLSNGVNDSSVAIAQRAN
jgi:hypothetical protein